VPALADSGSFEDKRCDLPGYDYFADEHISGSCKQRGIDKVEFGLSRNGVVVQAILDDLFPNALKRDEKQTIWFDTDRDSRPDHLVKMRYDSGALYAVRSFTSPRKVVRCIGDRYRIGIINEKMTADIPRQCVGKPKKVRIIVETLDRYDSGKSTWRDVWPAGRRWSRHLGI